MENIKSQRMLDYRRNKMFVIIAVVILYIIYDMVVPLISASPPTGQVAAFVSTILFGFLILLWCSIDSAENDEPLGTGWNIAIVVFGIFALIVYLFKTRGVKKGIKSFGWLLLFLLLLLAVSMVKTLIFGAFYLPK